MEINKSFNLFDGLTDEEIKELFRGTEQKWSKFLRDNPWPSYFIDMNFFSKKDCTCDFYSVLMVSGCQCGGN